MPLHWQEVKPGLKMSDFTMLDYLRRVCPERLVETEAFFKISLDTLSARRGIAADQLNANINKLKELRLNYNELFVFLELNGVSLSVKASQGEYEQMRELARVLVQSIDCAGQANIAVSRQSRDRYMADNFRRLIDQQPPGSRAVIWAHIDHITKEANSWMSQPLGSHLRRLYGNDYYALGFTTNQGTFQAREARPKDAAKPMVNSYVLKNCRRSIGGLAFNTNGCKKLHTRSAFKAKERRRQRLVIRTTPHAQPGQHLRRCIRSRVLPALQARQAF
jgi:erythromycin esterase-like protein